jgi:hypothetical protein
MGLCLGFSLASFAEILYWFLYRIWFPCKKNAKVEHAD